MEIVVEIIMVAIIIALIVFVAWVVHFLLFSKNLKEYLEEYCVCGEKLEEGEECQNKECIKKKK
jgi:hypothetical protein